jgi:hypothetical protein
MMRSEVELKVVLDGARDEPERPVHRARRTMAQGRRRPADPSLGPSGRPVASTMSGCLSSYAAWRVFRTRPEAPALILLPTRRPLQGACGLGCRGDSEGGPMRPRYTAPTDRLRTSGNGPGRESGVTGHHSPACVERPRNLALPRKTTKSSGLAAALGRPRVELPGRRAGCRHLGRVAEQARCAPRRRASHRRRVSRSRLVPGFRRRPRAPLPARRPPDRLLRHRVYHRTAPALRRRGRRQQNPPRPPGPGHGRAAELQRRPAPRRRSPDADERLRTPIAAGQADESHVGPPGTPAVARSVQHSVGPYPVGGQRASRARGGLV